MANPEWENYGGQTFTKEEADARVAAALEKAAEAKFRPCSSLDEKWDHCCCEDNLRFTIRGMVSDSGKAALAERIEAAEEAAYREGWIDGGCSEWQGKDSKFVNGALARHDALREKSMAERIARERVELFTMVERLAEQFRDSEPKAQALIVMNAFIAQLRVVRFNQGTVDWLIRHDDALTKKVRSDALEDWFKFAENKGWVGAIAITKRDFLFADPPSAPGEEKES